jgi:hypothetical protein
MLKELESSWKMLAKSLVKEGNGDVPRYINRGVSTAVSLALYMAGMFIHPNTYS